MKKSQVANNNTNKYTIQELAQLYDIFKRINAEKLQAEFELHKYAYFLNKYAGYTQAEIGSYISESQRVTSNIISKIEKQLKGGDQS